MVYVMDHSPISIAFMHLADTFIQTRYSINSQVCCSSGNRTQDSPLSAAQAPS